MDELIRVAASNGMPACSKLRFMTADEIWMRSPSEQCEEEFTIYKEISEFVFRRFDQTRGNGQYLVRLLCIFI